jgi:DNA polymerase-3 subunit gamma/tau
VDVRRLWPEVIEAVKGKRRLTWIQLSQHAQVVGLDGRSLTLGFNNPGARESFVNGRSDVILQQVLIDLVGQDWKIEAIVDPSAQPGTEQPLNVTRPAVPEAAARVAPLPPPEAAAPSAPPDWAVAASHDPAPVRVARDAIQPTRSAGEHTRQPTGPVDTDAHRDDPDAEDVLDGADLLTQRLGAKVIEEIPHD